jgi:UDP-N-acetylglucosamine--N-acetylmuramyl-(pentapeptide) pyrophosphoryl-undecaprenol N-acetylglucosamine transferase
MEMEKVPAAGYPSRASPSAASNAGRIVKNLALPWRLLRSMWKARNLVRTFKPHVAVGVGGYASGSIARRGTAHERAHAHPGTEQLPGEDQHPPGAAWTASAWPMPAWRSSSPRRRLLLTGNPVRRRWCASPASVLGAWSTSGCARDGPILFVTGGSLGARGINRGIEAALPLLKEPVCR